MKLFSWLCLQIWETSEFFSIPLGPLAPYVFGGIIGRWPHRVK